MARSKNTSLVRGRRIRATRVNAAGQPVIGDGNAVVTQGLITISYTTNTEEGEAIAVPDFTGAVCINDPAVPTFNGHSVEIEFCKVDFALVGLLTGQEIILDASGAIIGISESTNVNLQAVNFALELWTGVSADFAPAAQSQGISGYVLTPFLGGGVIGDLTVENDAVTFTVTGMSTKNGNGWGAGPYNVELVAGVPAPLSTPLKLNDHRRIQTVEVAPPAIYGGSIPVLDPANTTITDLTTTISARQVTFAPVPAAATPVFYDFGDGTFDYAATGGYTKTYAAAGTYTVKAQRNRTIYSETVTVA